MSSFLYSCTLNSCGVGGYCLICVKQCCVLSHQKVEVGTLFNTPPPPHSPLLIKRRVDTHMCMDWQHQMQGRFGCEVGIPNYFMTCLNCLHWCPIAYHYPNGYKSPQTQSRTSPIDKTRLTTVATQVT
jgi:hypothetical protein